MAAAAILTPPYVSEEEYLEREEKAVEKSEWIHGRIYAMAGASGNHVAIAPILSFLVTGHLRASAKTCRYFESDAKIRVSNAPSFLYADGSVSCPPNFVNRRQGVIDNPKVVFEILSPSTEAYDRGDKFMMYASLPSLEQYVLISSTRRQIEVWTRIPGGWGFEKTTEGTAFVSSIAFSLDLDALYEDVLFGDGESFHPA
ncbi:Uma2 family endonuclease [bacterium]|nr:MAG: Uma2 family endonuclease [bacterium]